ncbi:hypothetical protein PAQ31011_00651 [Pandoraea aquatica]|uniref:Uncharacterized protein n=1 Tax=Pandoraea aquatica TaxID=2508290 RepID=A0A5E4S9L1_9BURK|nr:hypothetical protein PAQ31011_00651 [Pandoraea aquatica]
MFSRCPASGPFFVRTYVLPSFPCGALRPPYTLSVTDINLGRASRAPAVLGPAGGGGRAKRLALLGGGSTSSAEEERRFSMRGGVPDGGTSAFASGATRCSVARAALSRASTVRTLQMLRWTPSAPASAPTLPTLDVLKRSTWSTSRISVADAVSEWLSRNRGRKDSPVLLSDALLVVSPPIRMTSPSWRLISVLTSRVP